MNRIHMFSHAKQSADIAGCAHAIFRRSVSSAASVNGSDRRGNTIVLVTGILVLLVIIATAYVTRTQASRYSATAINNMNVREDVHHVIADKLVTEVAMSLFVRNTTGTSSNAWRYPVNPDAIRYGVDIDPNFTFNFAPYHVVPWTNWPDDDGTIGAGNQAFWPKGQANQNGGGSTPLQMAVLAGEDNPFGNPGSGDTRWLRDLEPLRWDSNLDGMLDAYSHWRHMTNIARPDNAFRICIDIANIEGAGLVTDLSIPVEQWLTVPHNYLAAGSGNSYVPGFPAFTFWDQWNAWFTFNGYQSNLTFPANIPPNFYCLSDLDGDGFRHNYVIGGISQDRPESEFEPGTARNWVSRVLCDTDGDGYTDSFWFLAPTSITSGIRTIIGVSIVDNCGMINANVATRFLRNNFDFINPPTLRESAGHTPADIALIGDLQSAYINGNWNVGLFDNWENWYRSSAPLFGFPYYSAPNQYPADSVAYDLQLNGAWQSHVNEIGMYVLGGAGTHRYPDMFLRLDYWRNAASRPLSVDPFSRYTPFTLGDEIELRMFAGNNYPWAVTRFERSTEGANTNARLLRSAVFNEESSEYLDQLTNYQLVRDMRKRLTLFNGVRNDLMPPWTWRFDRSLQPYPNDGVIQDLNGDGVEDVIDYDLFAFGMRKFDLRVGPNARIHGRFYDFDGDQVFDDPGFWDITHTGNAFDALSIEYNAKLGIALRDHLETCLIDSQPGLNATEVRSYYGVGVANTEKTESLAAALAANAVQARDVDNVAPIAEAVKVTTPNAPSKYYLGMEPQPFLVEAFIAHVYKGVAIPPADEEGHEYTNAGDMVILEPALSGPASDRRSTIVVVQIANPYEVPIDLSDYKISVFGKDLRLNQAMVLNYNSPPLYNPVFARTILEPATDEKPTTAIYYSIHPSLIVDLSPGAQVDRKWLNFLDLEPNNHPPGTIIASADNPETGEMRWDKERDVYDVSNAPAVVLHRLNPGGDPFNSNDWIVVDRIDPPGDANREFGDSVNSMLANKPPQEPIPMNQAPGDADVPPDGAPYPLGYHIGPPEIANYWVDWRRVTRAWGVDLNQNDRYDPNEKNPRFVFGDRIVVEPAGLLVTDPEELYTTFMFGGNRFKFDRDPEADWTISPPRRPWFARSYRRADDVLVPEQYDPANPVVPRKPTFFDMNALDDPALVMNDPAYPSNYRSYPDKGWYSQRSSDITSSVFFTDPVTGVQSSTIRLRFPMQMLHKNGDFEQIGELLNVFMYGHEIELHDLGFGLNYAGTTTTFSEHVSAQNIELVGQSARINRLRLVPTNQGGQIAGEIIGVGVTTNVSDVRHSIPDLPATARLLDAFVCDGYGIDPYGVNIDKDYNLDGLVDAADAALRDLMIFGNAKNFDGSATPGMLNLNTASIEALRALPHWYRLVHETGRRRLPTDNFQTDSGLELYLFAGNPLVTDGSVSDALLPRTLAAEALWHYRERFNGYSPTSGALNPTGVPYGADYDAIAKRRGAHGDRGMVSIGEIGLLIEGGQGRFSSSTEPNFEQRPTANSNVFDRIYDQHWKIDMGLVPLFGNDPDFAKPIRGLYPPNPLNPQAEPYQSSIRLSTDRIDAYDPFNSDVLTNPPTVVMRPDNVAGDVEEANALLAGVSNLVTTRSDTFTVYFRVRSFRQNISVDPPIWDATNPEYIVDDSRYVMLVDRSNVNKPGDKPRILYLEKLPN